MSNGSLAHGERDTRPDPARAGAAAEPPARATGWSVTAVIAEDGVVAPPGLMPRGEFLDLLSRDLVAMVDEELHGTGLTGAGCPIIERLVERYRAAPLTRWQRFLEQWVPATADRSADGLRAAVTARARAGVREWRTSGDGSALMPGGALGVLGAAAGAVGLRLPADPVAGLLEAVLHLGPGEPLAPADRQRLAAGLGADTATVRVHRAPALPGLAATAGDHVVLGPRAPAAGTLAADALLAHEVTHAVQQRSAPATDAAGAERQADAAALATVAGGRAARPAGTGLRLASCGTKGGILVPGGDAERLTAEQIPALAGRKPAPTVASQKAFAVPAAAKPGLGERLESSDPATRAAAIQELSSATGPDGWRLVVLASASPVPEVAAAAERLVADWLARPDFLAWLAALPQGGGQLGDLAAGLLARAGKGDRVDLDAYRGILRQQLQLLRFYRGELVAARSAASVGPDTSFGDLEAGLATTDPIQLAGVGRRVSRLLERFTLIRAEVARADSIAAAPGLAGPMAGLVRAHRQAMLDAAVTIGPEEKDAAFASVLAAMRQFTARSAKQTVTELQTHVNEARDDLRKFLAPVFGFPPAPQLTAVIPPLLTELDALAARTAAWQPAVDTHPVAVLEDLGRIQPSLASLLARVRLARGAVSLERAVRELESTTIYTPPVPSQSSTNEQRMEISPVLEGSLDIAKRNAIAADLRTYRDNFALLAERYEQNPARAEELAATGGKGAERAAVRANSWMISQNTPRQLDLMAAELQLAVAILIISAWTGGVVGGITADVLASTGIGGVFGGSLVIAAGSVIAEGSAFYVTQRGLDWVVHGGQGDIFPDTWRRDLALSIGAVAALRGTGRLFETLAGARPPTTGLAAGRFAFSYATLLAYTSIVEPLVKQEPIAGLGTAKFWTGAGETLLMMGAAHVGLAAMRPLTLRVTEPFLRARLSAHNVRAERIGADLEALFRGELDPARTRSVVRRSQALLRERVAVMRDIAARNSPDLSPAEVADLSRIIDVQIQQADSTLLLDAFRVRPLATGQNIFGYEGTAETISKHFQQRGFTVITEDPGTGLLRLRDPSGQELTFFRLHAGATGADPRRMPSELDLSITKGPAEVERRAAESYQTIRSLPDDVPRVAQNTGVPARVIEAVRQHLFLRLHRIAVAPGRAQMQRFDPMYSLARLWLGAYDGVLTGPDLAEFRRLMAHEYVEQGLMEAGMPYRSAHPRGWQGDVTRPGAQHFGAHDVAPSEHMADPYAFRKQLGLDPAGQPVPQAGEVWDYDAALRSAFESLAARIGGPYRVVADPAAPNGFRIEARDPAELGALDPRGPGTTRTTGAGPAWNSIRTQLTSQGLSPTEAADLTNLLEAAGRTPADSAPVAALTADQLRQLLPMDAAGLGRVLAIDQAVLPDALSLSTWPTDLLGGRALDALLQRMGRDWVQALVAQPPGSPNRAMLGDLGRNALGTAQLPLPTQRWSESNFSQPQLERILDQPGSGFERYRHPGSGNPISEPGFKEGQPLNRGRPKLSKFVTKDATYPDIYGTVTATGQAEAMELKTVGLGDTVATHFRNPQVAAWIETQHGGRIVHLPRAAQTYLVVDIRQSGQTIAEALRDLSTVMRNYGRMGDARRLWVGVRFMTGTPRAPVLSPVYTIP